MAQEHLDREVSVEAAVDGTGVRAKARSRSVAGLDGLVGSLLDACAAKLEGWTRLTRARDDARAQAIKAMGDRAKQEILSAPAIGREGARGLMERERRPGGLLPPPRH